jgi:hypothetical protein
MTCLPVLASELAPLTELSQPCRRTQQRRSVRGLPRAATAEAGFERRSARRSRSQMPSSPWRTLTRALGPSCPPTKCQHRIPQHFLALEQGCPSLFSPTELLSRGARRAAVLSWKQSAHHLSLTGSVRAIHASALGVLVELGFGGPGPVPQQGRAGAGLSRDRWPLAR